MPSDPSQNAESVAVEQLERFGLSSYAARTFVALASLGTGTARDVSQVSDVPRTRVYGAVEELQGRGLVDVQESSPKQFWATSPETASRTFENDFRRRVDLLRSALDELEPRDTGEGRQDVWTVDGGNAVEDRVLEFIDGAEEEVIYVGVEELYTDDVIEALGRAADRGASVKLGGASSNVTARIEEGIPSATTFEPLWDWSASPSGRLLVVDGRKTLVSTFSDNPGAPSESGIVGNGAGNSLVTVLKEIAAWRLDRDDTA